jgi:hypothetical protein
LLDGDERWRRDVKRVATEESATAIERGTLSSLRWVSTFFSIAQGNPRILISTPTPCRFEYVLPPLSFSCIQPASAGQNTPNFDKEQRRTRYTHTHTHRSRLKSRLTRLIPESNPVTSIYRSPVFILKCHPVVSLICA